MNLPFYRHSHRSLAFALILLMVYILLVLTGLGVFRLYFSFEWTAESQQGQLFALSINGGQSLNLFEAAPFGRAFWITQACLIAMALSMPFFRVPGALIIAMAVAVIAVVQHMGTSVSSVGTPLEFELLIVVVLLMVHLLLDFIGNIREQKNISRLLSKFVPEEISEQYQRNPNMLKLAGDEREISVLFCDIRDFSTVAQALNSAQLAEWLNSYFEHVSKIIVRYRGSIDKYMGDSVMAVWGAPMNSESHAYDALRAALDIQSELHLLNEANASRQLPAISMGIGIGTGMALVGPLGSEYRMDYTVVGETVNVAQRLESQTRKYHVPVIVGDTTIVDLPDMLFRELDTVTVKGTTEPVTMYEPLCAVGDASDALLENLSTHEEAMAAAAEGDWQKAEHLFKQLRDGWGPAKMYELYLHGIEQVRSRQ